MTPGVMWAWLSAWALGTGAVLLCWPRERWRTDACLLLGLGLASGLGLTSVIFFGVSLLPAAQHLPVSAGIEGLVLLGLGLAARRRADAAPLLQDRSSFPTLPSWATLITGALFAHAILLAGVVAFRMYQTDPHGGWDAWAIWNLQARAFVRSEGDWPAIFQHAQLAWAHGDYPRGVPASVARFWMWAGSEDPGIAAWVSTSFALATLGILVGTVRSLRSTPVALICGLILLGTPGFVLAAPNAHADVPLACLFLAAVVVAVFALRIPESRGLAWLAGALVGLASWIKNEGLLFAVVVTLLVGVILWRNRQGHIAWRYLAGLVVALAPTLVLKLVLAPPNDVMTGVTQRLVSQMMDLARHATIVSTLARDAVAFTGWERMLYPALLLACLAPPWKGRRLHPGEGLILPAVAAVLVGYYAVYVISPHNLQWHLDSSLVRLFLHLTPLGLLAWALLLPATPGNVLPTGDQRGPRGLVVVAFVALNLLLAAGLLRTLAHQPRRGELAVTRTESGPVVLTPGEGWFATESDGRNRWTWSRGPASLKLHASAASGAVTLALSVRSLHPRSLVVRTGEQILWQGRVGEEFVVITLPNLLGSPGGTILRFETDEPAVKESDVEGARALAFLVFDPVIR